MHYEDAVKLKSNELVKQLFTMKLPDRKAGRENVLAVLTVRFSGRLFFLNAVIVIATILNLLLKLFDCCG